jgi:hypothetical protein
MAAGKPSAKRCGVGEGEVKLPLPPEGEGGLPCTYEKYERSECSKCLASGVKGYFRPAFLLLVFLSSPRLWRAWFFRSLERLPN